MRASPIRQVLVFDGKGLSTFYLVGSGDGHGAPHVIIGIAHLLPVQVGRLCRYAPLVVIDGARSIAVSVFYRSNEAVKHIIVGVGIEHALSLAVLRLGELQNIAIGVVVHIIHRRSTAVMLGNLGNLSFGIDLGTAFPISSACRIFNGDVLGNGNDILIR